MWGQIAAATIGYLGQRKANQANSAQAARSMAFQKEMAKNAHQYEVEDLKKAGLNPLLSGTGGKGASASGGAQAKIENEANSAMTSRLLNAQTQATKASQANTEEQTKLIQYGLPGKTVGTLAIDKTLDLITPTSAKDSINKTITKNRLNQRRNSKSRSNRTTTIPKLKSNKTKTRRGYR